jgi:alginate O-acetyltransferase complex protein AlgI
MGSVSFGLIAFAVVAACVYNIHASVAWRQATLFIANFLFLAAFSVDPRAWLPFFLFLGFGYAGLRLAQRGARAAFWPVLGTLILGFIWLKKYAFLPSIIFLHPFYMVIGLSYIFFRVLHLIIDAYSQALPDSIGLVSYLNYTLNFTTLVSGPIQLYQDFAATHLRAPRPLLDIFAVGEAIQRVIVGFFKVTVLSLLLSLLQERAINVLSPVQGFAQNLLTGTLIVVSYPVYLYCNFSGYMDVMIGLAGFMRFNLPENFNRPFSAQNFIDFWNRWHITLSSWLKIYVYNPLLIVLMRRIPSANAAPFLGVIAYFITFFLIGIWHGQTSEFVVYGIVLGLGVSINKLWQIILAKLLGRDKNRALQANSVYNAFSRGFTFTWFAFSLVFFWSNWSQMEEIVWKLPHASFAILWLIIVIGATLALAGYEAIRKRLLSWRWPSSPFLAPRYARVVYCTTLAFASVVVVALLNLPAPRIVYRVF